jgi:large subunit ribosomal protein L18
MSNIKASKRQRVKFRVRNKISGTTERPRLSIFRSNTAVYAQIIDDTKGITLASASTTELGLKGVKIDNSKAVGAKVAEKAIANGISTVVFDRNGYLYHGNVKALAEGAREGGLIF